MDYDSVEFMLDLTDPVMDMVDAAIDEFEDTEFELEACLDEAYMVLVDLEADRMASVPGFLLGMEESEIDSDLYDGITLL